MHFANSVIYYHEKSVPAKTNVILMNVYFVFIYSKLCVNHKYRKYCIQFSVNAQSYFYLKIHKKYYAMKFVQMLRSLPVKC